MLSKLVELIEGGYIGQAIIATAVWGVIVYLAATGQPTPDWLIDAGMLILGFFFRSSIAQQAKTNGR